MPVIDGKVRRARFTSLKLAELSSVDRPAQAGAKAVIMKRADDGNFNKGETTMPTIEELQAENTTLKAALATAKASCESAEEDKERMALELADTKKALAAATDETITVGGETFSKSLIGDASFSVMKAMAKERDEARFEKRASEEFPNLVGTPVEKGLVLAAMEKMDDATKTALSNILVAAEKMTSAGFGQLGTQYPGQQPTEKAARGTFDQKVSEIEKRDSVSKAVAMQTARREFPEEFRAAYPN